MGSDCISSGSLLILLLFYDETQLINYSREVTERINKDRGIVLKDNISIFRITLSAT